MMSILKSQKHRKSGTDEVNEYTLMLFQLTLLLKNLDSGIDMGDGQRVVPSAKYELPIYNLTNKVKYMIGSIHLTALTSGILPEHQKNRLIANSLSMYKVGRTITFQ